ncbi:HAMP domain-containing histidine kinase [Clostridiaceae bacterium NSJ-31]|uniref:histidine kinase n=1 Tax=Ligaoa zhengdingensis TaxID=2763658 RepID=A0A926I4Q5_9FIRM|nr:HAMP domain-containing sensor histidine kinase [Ligaoa zhengdingensis]MBC8547654.1 HAMP domain-containing histidine kinase [Ligaoa zhengdingensis]
MKKRKPGVTFFFFALAVTLLLYSVGLALYQTQGGDNLYLDYRDTPSYTRTISGLIADAYYMALGSQSEQQQGQYMLDRENGNLDYFVQSNQGDGIKLFSNTEALSPGVFNNLISGGNYSEYIRIAEDKISISRDSRWGSIDETQQVLENRYAAYFDTAIRNTIRSGYTSDVVIYLAVRPEGQFQPHGDLYGTWSSWKNDVIILGVLTILACISLLILLVVAIKHKSLALANRKIAHMMGWFWLEAKAALTVLAVLGGWRALELIFGSSEFIYLLLFLSCFWWCWFLLLDLCYNKARVFTHNSISSISKWMLRFVRSLENKHDFLQRMKQRFIILVASEFLLILLFFVFLYIAPLGWIIDVVLVGLGIFLLVDYIKRYNRNVDEFGLVMDYVREVKNGTVNEPLILPPEDDFAPLANDLSDIQSGISRAVEEQVRSERMKVELVTNVSHDLKTPLTSIINYVDLLSKEELDPAYANDYVKIIAQKADRLKNLVQDLFEISRANSGAIELHPEQIDVVALVEQTIAEMDQRADALGLELRTQFAVPRLMVWADGKKLHRVFENLLGNALKYSLAGTRIYIAVLPLRQEATIIFKNIANYEMHFSPEDIVERFQRGDASRTTEGSGLGLAIAKSFVELCGGTLAIEVDGDLFKATASLPICAQPEAEAPADEKAPEPLHREEPEPPPAPGEPPEAPEEEP